MKRSMQRAATVSTLMGAYFWGALHNADQLTEASSWTKYGTTFTAAEREQVLDIRQKVVERTGNLANVRLVLLENKETFDCKGQNMNRETGPVYFGKCDAVIIGASALNKLQYDYADGEHSSRALNEFVISHEYGHGTQTRNNEWPSTSSGTFFEGMKRVELQADCYAGQTMRALNPDDIHEVKEIILNFPTEAKDPGHGSYNERAASFMNGADGKPCIQ